MSRTSSKRKSYDAPSDLMVYPVTSVGPVEAIKAMRKDFEPRVRTCFQAIKLSKKIESAHILPLDVNDPVGFHSRAFAGAKNIYVMGHGDGYTFGDKLGVLVSMDASQLADWLVASELLSDGMNLFVVSCYSASKWDDSHVPFAQKVQGRLVERGLNIVVTGYNGVVYCGFDNLGKKRLSCRRLWSAEESEIAARLERTAGAPLTRLTDVDAGKSAVEFKL